MCSARNISDYVYGSKKQDQRRRHKSFRIVANGWRDPSSNVLTLTPGSGWRVLRTRLPSFAAGRIVSKRPALRMNGPLSIFRPSRRIKIYFEIYEIWLETKKRLCDSSAEEENILGNVALSPQAAYHLPLETHFSDLHVESKYILKYMRFGWKIGRAHV